MARRNFSIRLTAASAQCLRLFEHFFIEISGYSVLQNWPELKRLTLSVSGLTAIFPSGPRLAGSKMSQFWILLEQG